MYIEVFPVWIWREKSQHRQRRGQSGVSALINRVLHVGTAQTLIKVCNVRIYLCICILLLSANQKSLQIATKQCWGCEATWWSQEELADFSWLPDGAWLAFLFLFFITSVNWPPLKSSLEKAMAPHSSALAWKIPRTEEPGGLQSMGSLRVGHDWVTSLSLFTFTHWRRKWQPTPVFLPGESQGLGSLVGCRLWGRIESDTTEET